MSMLSMYESFWMIVWNHIFVMIKSKTLLDTDTAIVTVDSQDVIQELKYLGGYVWLLNPNKNHDLFSYKMKHQT